MDLTPNLELPYIVAAQAQKHVTHNEAIRALDAIVQLAVLDRDLAAPPASPADGDRYIVPAGASGAWAGHTGDVAAYQDGAWAFFTPDVGWLAWVVDESILAAFTGAEWQAYDLTGLPQITLLGVNATADASARLSVASPATLFSHEGAGHQLKINKAAAGDTASLLFQTGFSGRAEVGLAGDDDLHVKVSPDGSNWAEALKIGKANGDVTLKAASGPVVTHDTAASVSSGGYDLRLTYNGGVEWNNGPGGEPDYTNDVWALGLNVGNTVGVRADSAKPYVAFEFESKFYQGGTFVSEVHLATVDTGGGVHRPWTFLLPHDGGAGSICNVEADKFNLAKFDGTVKVQFDWTIDSIDMGTGVTFRKGFNNQPMFRQLNAAGDTNLFLPYIDDGDCLLTQQPLFLVSARAGAAADYPGTVATLQMTSANSGDTLLNMVGPNVTGSLYAFKAEAEPSGDLKGAIYNNRNAAGAHAFLDLRTVGASAGDPYIRFDVNGAGAFSIGVDNSDGDKFKISANWSGVGTNDRVTIDANTVAFGLPPKVPSYTVAGLPSAATVGAGSLVFVSNESGGAVLAYSDGSNWLRVTDRAVVS